MQIKIISYYVIVLAGFLSFALFGSFSSDSLKVDKVKVVNNINILPQVIKPVDYSTKQFFFADEIVPIKQFDVMERLDRELLRGTYWHSKTLSYLKLANRYFPMIEPILAQNGVPDDFKYLAVAESGLRNVTSPAGAKGLWQFMKGTGKDYHLQITSEIDERYHVEKATQAACDYLLKLKNRFGTWSLAAAAYNMGGGGLNKNLKIQKQTNFFDLNLNQETMRYYFRLVAIKELMSNPENYGFQIGHQNLYKPLDDFIYLAVEKTVENWGDFANQNGISYRMLKIYNPWIISTKLTNAKGKKYLVKIPKQKF